MEIKLTQVQKKPIVAGKYKATKDGFLFERMFCKGDTVNVSAEFLTEHKEKTGRDFSSSWLELVEAEKLKPAAKPSK